MECYDIGDADWPRCLELKGMGRNRRGARYGFPVRQTGRQLRILLDRGVSVMLIREQNGTGTLFGNARHIAVMRPFQTIVIDLF